MSINISQAFKRTSANPVDESLTLTKAQMRAVNDNLMPSKYFTIGQDDGYIYLYDKANTVDPTTGKFRKFEGGGGTGGASDLADLEDVLLTSLANGQTLVWDSENSKWVNADFPTVPTKTSDLTNDSGFITKAVNDLVNYYLKSETYSKTEVDNIADAIKNSRFEVVATLPTSNIKTNVIYLVPSADPKSGNVKDEYINLNGTSAGWECIGSTSVDLSGYVTDEELNIALANYTTTTDLTALLAGKQDKVQYSTLPTPSAELEGKIFEYTGATGGGLTHGYFYECVSDGEATPTYSWQQTNVQPSSGGGGGGHTIEDSEGTDLTQRDTLQFGEGFKAEDDSTNEKTVISPDKMQSGDMSDVITPLPSVQPRYHKYSTEEQMVGEWIDGKPIYQKTFVFDVNTYTDTVDRRSFTLVLMQNISHVISVIAEYRLNGEGSRIVGDTISAQGSPQYNVYGIQNISNEGKVILQTLISNNVTRVDGIVTIQYTKTTD